MHVKLKKNENGYIMEVVVYDPTNPEKEYVLSNLGDMTFTYGPVGSSTALTLYMNYTPDIITKEKTNG